MPNNWEVIAELGWFGVFEDGHSHSVTAFSADFISLFSLE